MHIAQPHFPTHCPRSAMNQWIGVTTELPTAREEGGEIRRQGIPRPATLQCLGRTLATLPVLVENLKFLKEFTVSDLTNFTELDSSQQALKTTERFLEEYLVVGGFSWSGVWTKNWSKIGRHLAPGPPPRWVWTGQKMVWKHIKV